MQTLTEKIIHSDLKNRIFTERQLKHMLSKGSQSRYGLVHRAMQAGEIKRIRRGLYTLSNLHRNVPCHPFAIAQALVPLSYVSFETALAWHGWIPESVQVTASVISGRKKGYCESPEFGTFIFFPLALERGPFLQGVTRQQVDGQTFLLADPLRALFDLVCLRKMEWSGLSALTQGLRIEESALFSLDTADFRLLESIYKQRRTRNFIESLVEQIQDLGGKHD
jgi:predicted transcriptional regulator of viral defense system